MSPSPLTRWPEDTAPASRGPDGSATASVTQTGLAFLSTKLWPRFPSGKVPGSSLRRNGPSSVPANGASHPAAPGLVCGQGGVGASRPLTRRNPPNQEARPSGREGYALPPPGWPPAWRPGPVHCWPHTPGSGEALHPIPTGLVRPVPHQPRLDREREWALPGQPCPVLWCFLLPEWEQKTNQTKPPQNKEATCVTFRSLGSPFIRKAVKR